MVEKRLGDGVAKNVYYYGIFTPAATMDQFCGQGCVAGLSPASSDPEDDFARGSIGLGYVGMHADAAGTFVHEVGHAHGREHAPCNVDDPDPDFPYADGEIGVWGYDAATKKLLNPSGSARDLMGYCDPIWISDYTYRALFERISYLNANPRLLAAKTRWRTVIVNGDGAVRGGIVTIRSAGGQPQMIDRTMADGVDQVPGRFYPFDHLPGGLLLIPEDADTGTLRFNGRTIH